MDTYKFWVNETLEAYDMYENGLIYGGRVAQCLRAMYYAHILRYRG